MENKELQKIWKMLDSEINYKSREELNLLLESKAKQTLNRFLIIITTSIFFGIGLLVFLVITALNRQDDIFYLANNLALGSITLISLVSGILSWYKINAGQFNQPVKEWLQRRIHLLSVWLTGKFSKIYLFIIPVLYILTVLSIHVYYEDKTMIDVLNNKESLIGLIVAAPIGLTVAYLAIKRIRKYHLKNLSFLKDLYGRLCQIH